jgi:hypothetical protein
MKNFGQSGDELVERLRRLKSLLTGAVGGRVALAIEDAATRIEQDVARKEALDWFAEQRRLELYYHTAVYGDDDDLAEEWRVDRRGGSINDRAWDTVGRGETPLEAIQNARASLPASPESRDTTAGGGC